MEEEKIEEETEDEEETSEPEEEETSEEESSEDEVEEETSKEEDSEESEVSEMKEVDRFNREMHKATCADCGKECEVPFKPSAGRPVYCRDCYRKHAPQRRY
jgi:CxxC-x17-CxxC domain-containing protein